MSASPHTTLAVKVTPRSAGDQIAGWCSIERKELSVRVSAAPDDGKANAALVALLSKELKIPKRAISLVRGHSSRHKLLELDIDPQRLEDWLKGFPVLR